MSAAWSHAVSAMIILNGVDPDLWVQGPGGDEPCGRAVSSRRRLRTRRSTRRVAPVAPITVAGPMLDRPYFDREIRPRLGDQVRYAGHLDQRELCAWWVLGRGRRHPAVGRALRAGGRRSHGVRHPRRRLRTRWAQRDRDARVGGWRSPDVRRWPASSCRHLRPRRGPAAAVRPTGADADGRRVRAPLIPTDTPWRRRRGVIGYYVHHVGAGHLHRARAVAAGWRPRSPVSPRCRGPRLARATWVRLVRDDYAPDPCDPTARGRLHWVPERRRRPAPPDGRACRRGSTTARPDVLVSDVSVEVALLARLHGVPVVSVVLPGRRGDRAHRGASRSAAASSRPGRAARGMVRGLAPTIVAAALPSADCRRLPLGTRPASGPPGRVGARAVGPWRRPHRGPAPSGARTHPRLVLADPRGAGGVAGDPAAAIAGAPTSS